MFKLLAQALLKTVQQLREDNPQAIAQEFEKQGLNSQNPDFLRRAKQFYHDLR